MVNLRNEAAEIGWISWANRTLLGKWRLPPKRVDFYAVLKLAIGPRNADFGSAGESEIAEWLLRYTPLISLLSVTGPSPLALSALA